MDESNYQRVLHEAIGPFWGLEEQLCKTKNSYWKIKLSWSEFLEFSKVVWETTTAQSILNSTSMTLFLGKPTLLGQQSLLLLTILFNYHRHRRSHPESSVWFKPCSNEAGMGVIFPVANFKPHKGSPNTGESFKCALCQVSPEMWGERISLSVSSKELTNNIS